MSTAPDESEEKTICFCHAVSLKTLMETIKAGAVTFEQLQSETACSTGCGGCEPEVREILENHLKLG